MEQVTTTAVRTRNHCYRLIESFALRTYMGMLDYDNPITHRETCRMLGAHAAIARLDQRRLP